MKRTTRTRTVEGGDEGRMKKEGEERVKKTRRREREREREMKAELERRKRRRGEEGGGRREGGDGFGHTASPEEIFMGAHLRALVEENAWNF